MRTTIRAILNPKAGTLQKKEGIPDLLHSIFENIKGPYSTLEIVKTEGPGHATELAREASKQSVGLCIAVGGDGTMNETAQGLLHTETTLGIIPIGSGNGLARHIGLSMNASDAFEQLITGNPVLMDSAEANQRPYFLAAGIGFEGAVSHAFATHKTRGFQQYILSSMKTFLGYKGIDIEWITDSAKENGKVFTMTFANGAQYGNNAFIAPGASIKDGFLEMVVVRPFPFWLGPKFMWQLMRHELTNSNYYQRSGIKSVQIHSRTILEGHVDGEPVLFGNRVDICIKEDSLRIQVPINKQWF